MFFNKPLANRITNIYRTTTYLSSFPNRMFASLTIDRTPGKILHGGAEAYYLERVAKGELREDENQLDLAQQLEEWGRNYLEMEGRIIKFKDDYNKVVDLG